MTTRNPAKRPGDLLTERVSLPVSAPKAGGMLGKLDRALLAKLDHELAALTARIACLENRATRRA